MKLYDLLDRFFRDDPSLLYLCASEFAARNDSDYFPRKDSESESAGSYVSDESYAAPNDTASCGDASDVKSDDGTARSEDGTARSEDGIARSDDGYFREEVSGNESDDGSC